MKSSKLNSVLLFLVAALFLALMPACSAPEPEITEDPVIEEPAADTEPEEGEPELVWSVTHENNLYCVAMAPDGETLAVGEYKVTYIHLLADGLIDGVVVHEHSVEDLEFSLDGSILGAGQSHYGVLLTDIAEGTELMSLGRHGFNSRLAFSPDSVHLATGNRVGVVWLWRIADGEQVAALSEPEIAEKSAQNRWIIALNYHLSGSLLASTHNDHSVYIWDVEEERVVRKLQLGADVITTNSFRFSPDGRVMAGAVIDGRDHLVRLWTVDGAEQLAELNVPERVRDLAFSPDGSLLVVGSRLATTIWDVQKGTLLYTLDQTFAQLATDSPIAVAFTPDGGHVAVARMDGTIELWRLPGADPIVAPPRDIRQPPPLPSDVLFDPDSAVLKPTAYAELEALAVALQAEFTKATITFIGHTTSYGEPDYNLQLSADRASAVKAWFEEWAKTNGVDGWTLLAEGRGCSELKVPDRNVEGTFLEAAGALNRRVELKIEDVD